MSNELREKHSFQSLKCIWMNANLVKYKLCDRHFNCDICVFDRVMRNETTGLDEIAAMQVSRYANIIDEKVSKLGGIKKEKGFSYLKHNLVVKNLFGNTYYLGLNQAASLLLDAGTGYNYCRDGFSIKINEPLLQFIGDWGSIKVNSPFNFHCLGRLRQEIDPILTSEWFSLIEAFPADIRAAEISAGEFSSNMDDIQGMLVDSKNEVPNIGVTMQDGGREVSHLFQMIGTQRYHNILQKVFNI